MTNSKQTGFTLLELTAAGIIIGVLALILLDRLLRYQEMAEKTVMETTVVNMRSGLRLRIAELMMQNRMGEMASLSRENPISWLEAPPPSYAGQLDHPEQNDIPPGSWYFDSRRQELVYLPYRSRYFKPGPDGEKTIRFRVTSTSRKTGEGVTISLVSPYDWPVF